MTTKLIASGIWPCITAAAKKKPSRCYVAVAYFGSDGSSFLPLSKGSILVVDMSETAVRSGQTKPSEIEKLLKQNVSVHSVENLHAKVFVIGEQAFIGSTNASHHSAERLLEAVVQTDNRAVVSSCRHYVQSLLGEQITPEYVRKMSKLYKPPTHGGGARRAKSKKTPSPQHARLWLVPQAIGAWDEVDYEAEERGLPTARAQMRSKQRFCVDEFQWSGTHFLDRLKSGDLIIQVTDEGDKRVMVAPASRLLHVQRYEVGHGKPGIVFLERAKHVRQKNVKRVLKFLGKKANLFRKLNTPKVVRNRALVHEILNLWSSGGDA